ncbi:hypothetical protein BGZ59_007912 [Podila verticillata]|nr:hypothetical protein BGZ59_007912 [Podila verticillata]
MRLPSLILLASVALALTVQAQESNIVDMVVQVNGEIQPQEFHPPVPEVTAPWREGKNNEPQCAGPADPEVTAPWPGRGIRAAAVGPALPKITAPRQGGKVVAAKVVINAITFDEDEVDDEENRGNREMARSKGKNKGKGKGKGKEESGEKPTRTTDPEADAGAPEPEVTAPIPPGSGFQAQAHFARPAGPEATAPRAPGKGIKKAVKDRILRRGDDKVDEAGFTVPGPEVTAPAPQITAPVMEAEDVTTSSDADNHIEAVEIRVNGKVVADGEEGLAIAQAISPDPDVTAPGPQKPAVTAPAAPVKHIAEVKVAYKKNALQEEPSASSSENKPAGLLDGILDGLLGIDLGGKKTSRRSTTDYDEKDWDHSRLYGDDGYVPRPLPVQPDGVPNCEVLAFRDQMIWDQQGDHGRQVYVPDPSAEKAPKKGIPKTKTVAKPVDAGTDAPPSSSSSDKIKDKITDNMDGKGAVDLSGIHICLLVPCDDDNDDEDTRIDHIQKKFLKQFKGKALRIDSRTGCPLPSDKLT